MAIGKLGIARATICWTSAFCLALMMYCWPQPAAAQSIGTASAVKNQVQGIRAGATRALAAGGSVYSDDTVKTGDDSLAQLLFVDQTTFTVAADSQAVLSRVYHGKPGVAAVIANAVAGAFRFVSGVQTPTNYQIKFPQGYITVRGTIVDILAGADHSVIIDDEGAVTVHVYVTRASYDLVAGQMLVVHASGQVDGPVTMDATLMRAAGNTPFPLFGSILWPTQPQFQPSDPSQDLNGILNASRSSSTSSSSSSCETCIVSSSVDIKQDIHFLATARNGLRIYSFRYLDDDRAFVGVLAEEVLKDPRFAKAVVCLPEGYYAVDYAALGFEMRNMDEMRKAGEHAIAVAAARRAASPTTETGCR